LVHRHPHSFPTRRSSDLLDLVLAGATPALTDARPASGDWSAREKLAHLARHATVFLERLARILTEDSPRVGRYRAEDDPDWPRRSEEHTSELQSPDHLVC